MRAHLHGIVHAGEILSLRVIELVELALRGRRQCLRQLGLQLAAGDEALDVFAGLGVIGHHLRAECLLCCIALLLRDLAGLNFQHVAVCGLSHEILRRRCHAERRIDAGFFRDGFG